MYILTTFFYFKVFYPLLCFLFSVFLLLFILSAVLPEFFCLAACSHLCHPFSSCLLTPLCQLPVFAVWAEVSSLR